MAFVGCDRCEVAKVSRKGISACKEAQSKERKEVGVLPLCHRRASPRLKTVDHWDGSTAGYSGWLSGPGGRPCQSVPHTHRPEKPEGAGNSREATTASHT